MKINHTMPLRLLAMLSVFGSCSVLATEVDTTSSEGAANAVQVETSSDVSDAANTEATLTATKFDSVIGSDVLPGLKLPVLMDPNAPQDDC